MWLLFPTNLASWMETVHTLSCVCACDATVVVLRSHGRHTEAIQWIQEYFRSGHVASPEFQVGVSLRACAHALNSTAFPLTCCIVLPFRPPPPLLQDEMTLDLAHELCVGVWANIHHSAPSTQLQLFGVVGLLVPCVSRGG